MCEVWVINQFCHWVCLAHRLVPLIIWASSLHSTSGISFVQTRTKDIITATKQKHQEEQSTTSSTVHPRSLRRARKVTARAVHINAAQLPLRGVANLKPRSSHRAAPVHQRRTAPTAQRCEPQNAQFTPRSTCTFMLALTTHPNLM